MVNGRGSPTARVAFIGQGPGREEDEQGKCFVGRSGHVIAALVKLAGFDMADLFFDNAIRCLTPGNRTPKTEEIDNCRQFLYEEIGQLKPDLIVALGAVAVQSIMGQKLSLGAVAGRTLTHPSGVLVLPTYHPAAVLRNWALAPLVLAHLEKAKRIFSGEQAVKMEGQYMVVKSTKALDGVVTKLKQSPFLSLDVETTGTNWMDDEILCIGLSGEEGTGVTIPILGQGIETMTFWRGKYPEVLDFIGELLASPVPKALQNGSFDVRFLERSWDDNFVSAATAFGWRVENLRHDTMIYHKVLHEEMPKESKPNELGSLTALYTSLAPYDEELRRQSKDKRRMDLAENNEVWGLVARDADAVSRLLPVLRAQVEEEGSAWVIDNISIPMVRVYQDMTVRGILVDRPYFNKLCVYYGQEIKRTREDVIREAGYEFNPGSPQQLQKVLHQHLGLLKTGKKTDSAKECDACHAGTCEKHDATGKAVLEELYAQTQHPIFPPLLRYRELIKMKGTYLDGSDGQSGMIPHIKKDGRIHASFKVGGAETGRGSSSDPNMQNPPKDVTVPMEVDGTVVELEEAYRRCFIAPLGWVVLEADWSQLEVWVSAYLAEDWDFLDVLKSGKDIHVHVGRAMTGLDPEMTDSEWKDAHDQERRRAKDFVFGTQYGLTVNGVMERLGCDEEEAKAQLDLYFDIRPRLKGYIDAITKKIISGEDLVTPFGRRRHFPQIPILRAAQKGSGKYLYRAIQTELEGLVREGINMPTQASGSDLHSLSHIWSSNACKSGLLAERAWDVLNVHDSVVFEAFAPDTEFVVDTAWKVKEHWQRIARETILPSGEPLGWDIPVEVKWGPNWGHMPSRLSPGGELYLDGQ